MNADMGQIHSARSRGAPNTPACGGELHPWDSEPANRKWRIWRPTYAYAAPQWFTDCPAPPTHEPADVTGCLCLTFRTWDQAIAYVNQEAGQ